MLRFIKFESVFHFQFSNFILHFTDSRDDQVIESNKRFTTTSRLQLSPKPEEDYVEYSCQAKHKALQQDMPMRATVQLSVLCKYIVSRFIYIYKYISNYAVLHITPHHVMQC